MADCPTCEYYKQRAQLWRDEAYRLAGHPLPRKETSMTQDEMIELARQAGFAEPERIISTDTVRCVPDLAYFAELVAEKEREACAKLLETTDLGGLKDNPAIQSWVAEMLLAYVKAIRARGQA